MRANRRHLYRLLLELLGETASPMKRGRFGTSGPDPFSGFDFDTDRFSWITTNRPRHRPKKREHLRQPNSPIFSASCILAMQESGALPSKALLGRGSDTLSPFSF